MRYDGQGGFIFSGALFDISQKNNGLRYMGVDHQITLVAYQQNTLVPVSRAICSTAPRINRLKNLSAFVVIPRCYLAKRECQADAAGVCLYGAVAVPQEAVADFGDIKEKQGKVAVHCDYLEFCAALSSIQREQNLRKWESRCSLGCDIGFPNEIESIVQLDDAFFFQNSPLHIGKSWGITG
jgi:hypothetical protein